MTQSTREKSSLSFLPLTVPFAYTEQSGRESKKNLPFGAWFVALDVSNTSVLLICRVMASIWKKIESDRVRQVWSTVGNRDRKFQN